MKPTTTQFIDDLSTAARKNAVLRKHFRGGLAGEGKAETQLPDGRTLVCTFSQTVSLHGREQARTSFMIDGKRASKDQIAIALGDNSRAVAQSAETNPVLKAAFEEQAPQLTADYTKYIEDLFSSQSEKFAGKIPAYPRHGKVDRWTANAIANLHPHCDVIRNESNRSGMDDTLSLSNEKLEKIAKKYGEEVALQWFYKTNEKLGSLEQAELVRDQGGYVTVTGVRNGKKVVMRQQRILKQSNKGTVFHQFPALIYVDDKFVTEAEYKKMFE